MNAELNRALPDDRWRLASSVIATVIVKPGQQRDDAGQRRRRDRDVQPLRGDERHQRRGDKRRRQLEHVRRDGEALERQCDQADKQSYRRADRHVVGCAPEKTAAGRRHDAVAEDAKPPRIGGFLRQDLVDQRGAFQRRLGAVQHRLHHVVERREPPQVQFARLHANQVGLLMVQRPERRHDGGRRREELADDAQAVADLLENLLQAVRRVARLVQRMPQPQHEQRGVTLIERRRIWHARRI